MTLKGSTIEQYPPPTLYTITDATKDAKNSIQYRPVDFFVDSIVQLIFAKVGQILLIYKCGKYYFKFRLSNDPFLK